MLERLKIIGLSLLSVFAPIKGIMLTAFVLVVVDLITGLIAAYKRKEAITSAAFSRTTVKTMVYMVAIMTGFLAETYLTGPDMKISNIITSYIGFTEVISIIENLNTVSGGSFMKSLIDKLGSANGQDQKQE